MSENILKYKYYNSYFYTWGNQTLESLQNWFKVTNLDLELRTEHGSTQLALSTAWCDLF